MAMTMNEARNHHLWSAAYAQAARELHMPARGAQGSAENKERQRLGPIVAARARQLIERGEVHHPVPPL